MAVLDIHLLGSPVLRERAAEIAAVDDALRAFIEDMFETMNVACGIGLAANQVGVGWRVFSLDVSTHPKSRVTHGEYVLVNARIESSSRNEKSREGCMSVPDFTGDVKRASRIAVRGFLPGTGEEVLVETDAFEARALQDELDHLDGFVLLDRVVCPHAVFARKTYL